MSPIKNSRRAAPSTSASSGDCTPAAGDSGASTAPISAGREDGNPSQRRRDRRLAAAPDPRLARRSAPQATADPADRNKQAHDEKSVFAKAASSLVASIKSNPGIYSVAVVSAVIGGWAALKNPASSEPMPPGTPKPANPSKVIDAFIRNGTFGTLKADAQEIDGVVVHRGGDSTGVFNDPNNPRAGLLLCPQALKIFDSLKDKPDYQSEQGRFKLAMMSAIKVRQTFLKKPVMGTGGQNDLASFHVADSKAIRGGSPFLSLTLNEPVAAYFAAGGLDNAGRLAKPNKDGKVFKSSVNNESTIFPLVGGKVKGVAIGYDRQKMADRGMALTDKLKVPVGELVIVGGFYFNDVSELKEAFQQSPEQFRSSSDLDHMSSQMFDADKDSGVSYMDFSYQAKRIERQQGIDFEDLN